MAGALSRPVRLGLGLVAAGAATVGWAAGVEPYWFRLRRLELPLLPPGSAPLRVLHLSDLHVVPRQRRKAAWVAALAELRPDLVVNTGDTLSHPQAVPAALTAFGDLLQRPGAFVMGNNDYLAPILKSPHHYFFGGSPRRARTPLPWRDLAAACRERGWWDLDNARRTVTVRGVRIALAGVDDPYSRRDRYAAIAGPADPDAVVRIGVLHAPEPRVLDAFAADGYDLLLAGHTHGGQVCLPGFGALVTNCDLPRAQASGVSTWTAAGRTVPLEVSAGLGTAPSAPVRFACRPEAVVLELLPRA